MREDFIDPEYKNFLETYCADEEKVTANPETLLGEIEAKTRELIARRTTPLLEYIKNKKLEKQRLREEKREERRRRELEKKRLREEEKRKRREEERRKRKEAEKQKKIAEKERKEEIKIKLLKKVDKEEEHDSDKRKEKGQDGDSEKGKWEKPCISGNLQGKRSENALKDVKDRPLNDSAREHRERERERRLREKERERERQKRREDERRRQRERYEMERAMRTKEEEIKRGKEHGQDREKKGDSLDYMFSTEKMDRLGKEDKNDDMASKRERIRNKDRPAMQLYQPGARCRTRLGSGGKMYDCCSKPSEDSTERKYEDDSSVGAGSEKSEE